MKFRPYLLIGSLGLLAGAIIALTVTDNEFIEGLGMGLTIGAIVTVIYEFFTIVRASRQKSSEPVSN